MPEILAWAGVPPKFVLEPWPLPQDLEPLIGGRRGAFLYGTAGTGKTTMTTALLREDILLWGWNGIAQLPTAFRAEFGRRRVMQLFRFINFPDMVMELQDLWRSDRSAAGGAYAELKDLADVDHLIIDDVGAEKTTDYARQSLYWLLNKREGNLKKTSGTSNCSPQRLDEQFDERVSSRIFGLCEVTEITGKDRRITR